MGVDLQKYMFEVLAGDYGSPPADSDYGLGGINIAPDPSLKLEIFNNKMNTFGRIDDNKMACIVHLKFAEAMGHRLETHLLRLFKA